MDLFTYEIGEDSGNHFHLQAINGNTIIISSDEAFPTGPLVKKFQVSDEVMLLNYGISSSNSKYHSHAISFELPKSTFSENKQMICGYYQCELNGANDTTLKAMYRIKEGELNQRLLGIAKLISIPNDQVDVNFHAEYLIHGKQSNFNLEVVGIIEYMALISKNDENLPDYNEVIENFIEKNSKIEHTLWGIALKNKRISLWHYTESLNKLQKLMIDDMQTIKSRYIS